MLFSLFCLSILFNLAHGFLYTYVTGELTVTVSEVTYVSTVLDGQTYDFSFLEPSVTSTIHSAALESEDLAFSSLTGVTAQNSIAEGPVSTDTATTFTTISGSNTTVTTTVNSSDATVLGSQGSNSTGSTSAVLSAAANTSSAPNSTTSSKAGAGGVTSSVFLGSVMFFVCLL